MSQEIITKIKEIGIPEENVYEFYELLSEQVLDQLFQDLAEDSTDEELEVIKKRIEESKSTEHFETIIDEIATTVYGESKTEAIKSMYFKLIEDYNQNIKDAQELIEKANSGDAEAQEILEKAKQTEMYQNIIASDEPESTFLPQGDTTDSPQ